MSRRLNQVASTLPLLVLSGFVRQAALVQEHGLPGRQQEAPAERRGNLVRLVRLRDRRLRVDIGLEVADVPVGQMGERGIGEHREIRRTVRRLAFPHRLDKVRLAPAADAGVPIGRDIGRIERPERRLERPPAGQTLAGLRHGMTPQAARRIEDVFASGDRIFTSLILTGLLGRCGGRCEEHSAGQNGQRDAQARKP